MKRKLREKERERLIFVEKTGKPTTTTKKIALSRLER